MWKKKITQHGKGTSIRGFPRRRPLARTKHPLTRSPNGTNPLSKLGVHAADAPLTPPANHKEKKKTKYIDRSAEDRPQCRPSHKPFLLSPRASGLVSHKTPHDHQQFMQPQNLKNTRAARITSPRPRALVKQSANISLVGTRCIPTHSDCTIWRKWCIHRA